MSEQASKQAEEFRRQGDIPGNRSTCGLACSMRWQHSTAQRREPGWRGRGVGWGGCDGWGLDIDTYSIVEKGGGRREIERESE